MVEFSLIQRRTAVNYAKVQIQFDVGNSRFVLVVFGHRSWYDFFNIFLLPGQHTPLQL